MDNPQFLQLEIFENSLLSMNRMEVRNILTQGSAQNSPLQNIESLVIPALEHIGASWENGDVSLSQVYMSGRICEEIIDQILPAKDPQRIHQPPMAIVVLDDYHMLGKRIVNSTLRSSGFELKNYNHMDIETLVGQVTKDKIKILLISVLMFPSALHIKDLRSRLDEENLDVKIIVGGAPFRFDQTLWQRIGADAMGLSASDAIPLVRKFIEEMR